MIITRKCACTLQLVFQLARSNLVANREHCNMISIQTKSPLLWIQIFIFIKFLKPVTVGNETPLFQSPNNPYSDWDIVIMQIYNYITIFLRLDGPSGPGSPNYWGFEVTPSHITLCRAPLDEWSAHSSNLTTQNVHKRQTSMPPRDSNPQSQQASGRRPTP